MMRLPVKSNQPGKGFADKMEYYVVKAKRFIAAVLAAGTALGATAANMPPVVTITAPLAQDTFVAPATITLRASAADSDGTVASVSFYEGTNLIGTVTSAPYTYQWSGASVGSHGITAKVTDDLGAETISAAQAVTIQAPIAGVQVFYVYTDQVATARDIINVDGAKIWQADNEPFGANLANENPAGQGTFTYNPRFPGQYYDRETGLHYNYYRDYDPQTGRYLQSDPVGLTGGINTYGYVRGNPLLRIDPFGLCDFPTIVCRKGVPEVCIPAESQSDGCGVYECLVEHEKNHLNRIISENIDACKNIPDGKPARIPITEKVDYENSALDAELACLKKSKRGASSSCKAQCSRREQDIGDFKDACTGGAAVCKPPGG